jgi:hypothetical protein
MMDSLQMPFVAGTLSGQFFWIAAGIIALLLLFLMLRFFAHLIHFVLRFFWHGCAFIILLGIVLAILRYFKVI